MKTRTLAESIAWGVAVNARRKFQRIADSWDALLQDTLERLPRLSSGWDGSETQRAARDPAAQSYLDKRTAARLKVAECDATIKATSAKAGN